MSDLTEVMYDSANGSAIPQFAKWAAVYHDGRYAATPAQIARMEKDGTKFFRISNSAPPDWRYCSVGDFELGALPFGMARDFVTRRNIYRPDTAACYSSLDNLPVLRKGLGPQPAGMLPWIWVAFWPAFPDASEIAMIESRLAGWGRLGAIQYFNDVTHDYDISIKNPEWKHRT